MGKMSTTHHYLPVFFIKGFTDDKGLIWVYDKSTDRITTKPKVPKSIFFEVKGNTIRDKDNRESDIIEKSYSYIENKLAKHFIKCRTEKNLDKIEDIEHIAYLSMFMVIMFWRTNSDHKLFQKVLQDYKLSKADWDYLSGISKSKLITEEDVVKISKLFVPFEIFMEANKIGVEGSKIRAKVVDFKVPLFVISDNPILFRRFPLNMNDFYRYAIFPISKDRALVFLEYENYEIDLNSIKIINLNLLYQAKRYVAFYDREGLEEYVKAYRELAKSPSVNIDSINQVLFERINRLN